MPVARRVLCARAAGVMALMLAPACHSGPPAAEAPAPSAAEQAPAAPVSLPPGVTPEMVAAGERVFATQSCAKCHGSGGKGTPRAPDLTDGSWIHIDGSYSAIVGLVTTGFTKAEMREPRYPFAMNPRGGTSLSDEQIRSVAAYVYSISHK